MDLEAAAPQFSALLEVAAAMVLGGAIGYERESADRPAGFRTHMLVAGASALIVSLGGALLEFFGGEHPGVVSGDPFRLVSGVVAALGFIGAGTIFRRDQAVEGLTTAASVLFSGAIGVAVAIRVWWLAVGATLLALLVLRGLRRVEAGIHRRATENRPND